MTPNKPGTEFTAFVLIALLWFAANLKWTVFFGVIAVGWALNLWTVRRPLRSMIRAARAPDDPVPDWMEKRE